MVDEITHLVDTDFADMLSEEPGFIDYQAVADDDGRTSRRRRGTARGSDHETRNRGANSHGGGRSPTASD